LQLIIADFVVEVHDTHHPIGVSLYYEDQRQAGEKTHRGILEGTERRNIWGLFRAAVAGHSPYLTGRRATYADLSLLPDRRRAALRISKAHESVRARDTRRGSRSCVNRNRQRGPTSRPISQATAASPSTRRTFFAATRSWIFERSFRDGPQRPDLRCAIAHRGISRFRVRAIARPGMTAVVTLPIAPTVDRRHLQFCQFDAVDAADRSAPPPRYRRACCRARTRRRRNRRRADGGSRAC